MIPGAGMQVNDSPGARNSPKASLTMDPMLYALVNSQDTGRGVREEFYSLKFDLKVTDLSEINNPFVIFKNRNVDKNGYLIMQDEAELFLRGSNIVQNQNLGPDLGAPNSFNATTIFPWL
jgi:hypothetical protein